MNVNEVTRQIIRCAIEVHRHLGPCLLEPNYDTAMCIEFDDAMDAQMLTYLRVAEKRVGLLINFNSRLVTEGIKRFIL